MVVLELAPGLWRWTAYHEEWKAEVGTQSWEVTFEAGSYTYVCDPHASSMTGSFTVTG